MKRQAVIGEQGNWLSNLSAPFTHTRKLAPDQTRFITATLTWIAQITDSEEQPALATAISTNPLRVQYLKSN